MRLIKHAAHGFAHELQRLKSDKIGGRDASRRLLSAKLEPPLTVPAALPHADVLSPAPSRSALFPQHLKNPDLLVPTALGLIAVATIFEAVMLALEIALGGDDAVWHWLTMVGMIVVFLAVLASFLLMRRKIRQLAELVEHDARS